MFFKKKKAKTEESKIYYINLRCKKCGEIISKKQTSRSVAIGYAVEKDCHDCSQSTEDEYVICEPISVSEHPIGKVFSWE